jgi:hypothetical protein
MTSWADMIRELGESTVRAPDRCLILEQVAVTLSENESSAGPGGGAARARVQQRDIAADGLEADHHLSH